MPALLVRDLSEEGKRALAIRAAEHGRSQQAEAKAILEETLLPASDNFITMMRKKLAASILSSPHVTPRAQQERCSNEHNS